jgi:predicted AlkP superfamily pyrophosphatase or phosphodiesterase
MPRPLVVINVVGLTYDMLGQNTPNIMQLVNDGGFARPMKTILPAVTCSAQSTLLTGELPNKHGIVANGWYFRDLSEVFLWRQSNRLVRGERVYDAARKTHPDYTVSKMFWWYNMYADVDWSVTPRPCYPADGRKLFDSYSQPAGLKNDLQDKFGVFPLFKFWGPTANIESSTWIARASIDVFDRYQPDLTLIYLPHLDYNLQRLGPDAPEIAKDIQAVDAEVGRITKVARERNADIVVLSEYGITQVDRPIHINRILRESGYAKTRKEISGWETLDYGESRAFAVADHQIAHVYIRNESEVAAVANVLRKVDGIEHVLDRKQQAEFGIDHDRSGELVVVSDKRSWFTYYFWMDDRLAPDYARTVDIHRKPGYDPVELFVDPTLKLAKLRMAFRLAQKKLGFRYYMDVIGLDASIVKGSHGRLPDSVDAEKEGPVFVCSSKSIERDDIPMTAVKQMLLDLQFPSA